jgi:hypothetical protein
MRTCLFFALLGLMLVCRVPLHAQLVTYSFGSGASPTTAATFTATNLTASAFTGHLGSPGTGAGAPVYSAGSGGSYFAASTWTGATPGANYFEFTLTPTAGYQIEVTSISFGHRATSTGPTAFAVRSSSDGFASNLASGTFVNDGFWRASGTMSITLSALSSGTTFRIYGSGASQAGGTLRLDDVTLNGSVTAVPEPATTIAIGGIVALCAVAVLRGNKKSSA